MLKNSFVTFSIPSHNLVSVMTETVFGQVLQPSIVSLVENDYLETDSEAKQEGRERLMHVCGTGWGEREK